MKRWTFLAVIGLSAASSFAADNKSWWGASVGAFFPNSGEMRDMFGSAFVRFGIGPFEKRISERWRSTFDFAILGANKDGNRIFALPLTFGVTRSFGNPNSRSIPFVQVCAGPAFFDYDLGRGSERFKTSRVGGNANVELGILFDRRFAITLRGDFYTKTDDFDFSGTSITFAYAAFRW